MPSSAKILAAVLLASTFVCSHAQAQTVPAVPAATITALADALKDSDAEVRRQAAWALGRIRSEQSWRYRELDAPHMALVTHPAQSAHLFIEAARTAP